MAIDQTSADFLRAAMDAQGINDPETRAGIAAISMGESGMLGHVETGYTHTNNARIREVFGSRVEGLTDGEIDALKANDRTWFNFIYGPNSSVGRQLGNTQPDDGYNFRGRSFIQLTGRANYQRYTTKTGHLEVMDNPDLATDPKIGAALCVAYIADRYRGGGFEAMMRAVGNNTPDIAATKRRYYTQFVASGEFAVGTGPAKAATPPQPADVPAVIPSALQMQDTLKRLGLYRGALDGKWGPQSQAALAAYLNTK